MSLNEYIFTCETLVNNNMNKNLDLTKILANVPKGTKLFCTEFGYVWFCGIGPTSAYPIIVETNNGGTASFTKDGYVHREEYRDEYAEPSLFPAHDQRDWSKFEVPNNKVKVTLHPFDKVLVVAGKLHLLLILIKRMKMLHIFA